MLFKPDLEILQDDKKPTPKQDKLMTKKPTLLLDKRKESADVQVHQPLMTRTHKNKKKSTIKKTDIVRYSKLALLFRVF